MTAFAPPGARNEAAPERDASGAIRNLDTIVCFKA